MKTCTKCGKSDVEFEAQRRQCKICRTEYKAGISRRWYLRNKDYVIGKVVKWRQDNPERRESARKIEYARNAEAAKVATKVYAKLHPAKRTAWTAKAQAKRRARVPKWLSKMDYWMIEEIYELAKYRTEVTGYKWNVDHIIPLNGRKVSGLHVPTNLQVIPETVNFAKHNGFEVVI